jgi:hypothetical protein
MQVAFSDKRQYGRVYRNPSKAHRITYEQPEVSEMTFVIDTSRNSLVGIFRGAL